LRVIRLRQRDQSKLLIELRDRQQLDAEMIISSVNDNGNTLRVQSLIENGVGVNSADDTGVSAFEYACGQGGVEVVKVILPFPDVNDKSIYTHACSVK